MKNTSIIIFFLPILLLGIMLRYYRIRELGTFRGDQAIELSGTANILRGKLILTGIKTSISEVRNGAVMYYIMAPFLYLFHYDPIAGGFVQALLSLASLTVAYILVLKYLGYKEALLTSFFMATSSLLVLFSRQTLLAFYPLFFCSLALLLLTQLLQKYTASKVFFLGLLLGVMLQVHYSTIASLWGSIIAIWLLFPKKKRFVSTILLCYGVMIGFLPIIFFELRHEFFNSKMLLSFFSQDHSIASPQFTISGYWVNTIAKLFFGENVIISILFTFFFLFLWWKYRRQFTHLEQLCSLQISMTILFIFFFVKDFTPHYAITAFIPLIILASGFLVKIQERFMSGKFLSYGIVIMLCFLLLNFPTYGLFWNHGWTMAEGWNLPGVEKTARMIASNLTTPNYNVIMLVDGESQGMPLRYFLDLWGKQALPTTAYDKAEILYILTPQNISLQSIKLWELSSFGDFTVEKTWNVQHNYQLHRLGKKS